MTISAMVGSTTVAFADEPTGVEDAAVCRPVPGSGGYGYNVGAVANFTPVVQDYGLISAIDVTGCTTAELEVVAIPSVGTAGTCTLRFPAPVLGPFTGCASSTADPLVLQPGTTVQLRATFVGVGLGGPSLYQYSCTTTAPAAPKGNYGQVYVAPVGGSLFNWNVGSVRCGI